MRLSKVIDVIYFHTVIVRRAVQTFRGYDVWVFYSSWSVAQYDGTIIIFKLSYHPSHVTCHLFSGLLGHPTEILAGLPASWV
jgi:hypothetical protein